MGDITVQYGDYTLPRTVGKYRIERDGERIAFEVDFRVKGSSDSAFASACAEAETKCSLAYKDLTVSVGASTLADIDHAQSEGILGKASIRKIATKDSSRSRYYTFRWEAGLPASEMHGSTDGFVRFVVDVVTESNGRKTAQFSGRYTGHAGLNAKTKYDDNSSGGRAKAEAWLAATYSLSPSYRGWDRISETPKIDDQGQAVDYVLIYRERLIPEPTTGGLTTDAAANSNVQVRSGTIQRGMTGWFGFSAAPGDRGERLTSYSIEFTVEFATTVAYTALSGFYLTDVKPALLAYYANTWGGLDLNSGDPILLEENPALGFENNTLIVRWLVLAVGFGDYLSHDERITRQNDYNLRVRHLADGKGSLVIQSPGVLRSAIQELDAERVDIAPTLALLQPQHAQGRSGWRLQRESEALSRQFTYRVSGAVVIAIRASISRMYLWVDASGPVITPD